MVRWPFWLKPSPSSTSVCVCVCVFFMSLASTAVVTAVVEAPLGSAQLPLFWSSSTLLVVTLALGCWALGLGCGVCFSRLRHTPHGELSSKELYVARRLARVRAGKPISPVKDQ